MKRPRLQSRKIVRLLVLLAVAAGAGEARAQYGALLAGAGAVNRSFGGVATASPLSAAGAMFWNPATLPGLGCTQMEIGAELLFVDSTVSSSLPAGAFGPFGPPVPLAGRTRSDSSVFPLPTLALAYVPEGSDFSFGLGIFAVAGFGVDYAGSLTNPLLTAPAPNGLGFGPIYSDFQVLQIAPAVAYKLTDRLSVSAGPTIDLATLRADPGLFAPPDDANGDGFPTYPRASHGRTVWGAGFIVGVYYQADGWAVGASFKSPQWLDTFRLNSTDELNRPRELRLHTDLPMIVSAGASFSGLDRWVFGVDVRYVDYDDTAFVGESGTTPAGAIKGLGWRSIWAVALGAQYRPTDSLSVRLGYSWNENPVPSSLSMINTVSPVIFQNTISAGVSWDLTEDLTVSATYLHGFDNAITGPYLTLAGPVPGSSVRSSVFADSLVIGATLRFGGPAHAGPRCVAQGSVVQPE
jgi:long-chain fatty acid transport protein